ncbi:alpha-beta hydrolase superfamily lysophospholipase [Deinobacterium chartae]|uniref:Monoacylglycerol lipase n=1 Tax=Deinobacterium chartae TaxID=521158 RepID=A0A841HYG5_9DEIO|nr:alpha/beta hydrolase [Deinobacterium chartae]MBB6096825.1 alpha-beta hydrolase superfamily lysophospholipase [Deinobacterium chartae]
MEPWKIALPLAAYRCVPEHPKAAVLLLHGIGEHSGRHEDWMRRLCAAGYAAYIYDHRGHGHSSGTQGFVERLEDLVDDSLEMRAAVFREHPGLPLFLTGNSMGGLIAARSVVRDPRGLSGVILLGPALLMGENLSPLAKRAAHLIARVLPRLPLVTLETAALSRRSEVVQAYRQDPLVYHGRVRAGTAAQLVLAAESLWAHTEKWTLPTLILHGTDDRITFPDGSRRFYAQIASADKTFEEVPGGYHELFNDLEGERSMQRALTWLDERTGTGPLDR